MLKCTACSTNNLYNERAEIASRPSFTYMWRTSKATQVVAFAK
nr:MAG TPA: hypothetical protein [Caudoviricetes sp.]